MKRITIEENNVQKKLGDNFGLFFEDLNHAADGGLYAELVQNRSFEYCTMDNEAYHALTAWEKSPALQWEVRTEEPLNEKNEHYLHVKAGKNDWIANDGYNSGIYVEQGKEYDFSIWAKCPEGKTVRAEVFVGETADAAEWNASAAETLVLAGSSWKQYHLLLHAEKTTYTGKLYLRFAEDACCDLDMVSLFPKDTFHGRKNGLRKDIAEALAEMKPKFLRFPGGCLTHDGSLDANARNSMYRWQNTIGPVEERPTRRNGWKYNQTLGLGYYEYFLFCEDIGAKPLPVVPGGFNPHKGEGVPLSEIGTWVQETLDLIEFANGGTDTKWGGIRAALGHEEPFHLEYLAVGNEEIGDGFFERYPYFHNAIREKYPEIKIINSAGPFAVGEGYDAGWRSARKYGSDLIDEHYYCSPEWFLANMHHYEDYDENGTGIFLGEYASEGNTYYNALVEAAYMTHLERSKAVRLACYAPMLCNVDYVNWKPDMLWFDNHTIVKTPNYYVQKLFMKYQGTEELEVITEGLDEIIPLMEREQLDGKVTITGNDVAGEIRNVRITGADNTEISVPDFTVTEENIEHVIADLNQKQFVLEFDFQRTAGRKGIKISFGKRNDKNLLFWEFGGWDNWDCNVVSVEHGRNSTISHRIFNVDTKPYHLKLEVDGRHIKTYVNGEKYNDTVYRLPELEELYLTASKDEKTGTTIVKAVNLTGEEKQTQIAIQGTEKMEIHSICLCGYGLTEENTFETPDRIVPAEKTEQLKNSAQNEVEYTFAPHSFTVLVFR